MRIDHDPAAEQAAKVRASLRMQRGAATCDMPGCQVITQRGYKGIGDHMRVVHPEVNYARPGEGTEIS